MPIPFATDDRIKALKLELNQSKAYHEAAKNWEGDFYFVVKTDNGNLPSDVYLYMDLWHGECREAHAVADPTTILPEFVIEAPPAIWRKVIQKQLDPIQGLVTLQLKLKGPMLKIMKAPRAAIELVACCTQIETHGHGSDHQPAHPRRRSAPATV